MTESNTRKDSTSQASNQTFTVEDRSLLAPLLKYLVTSRVIKHIPESYSANALTLSGASCAAGVAILMWFAAPEMRIASSQGAIALCTCAFLLLSYAVFDQLDGIQARRLGTAGHLGDFIDHWVDTAIANLVLVPIMLMLGVESEFILLMLICTAFAFWSANWETRNVNKRTLPFIGGLESIIIACLMMIFTAIEGVGVWHITILNIKLLTWIYWLCLPWLLLVVVSAVRCGRSSLVDLSGFAVSIAPLSLWLLLQPQSTAEIDLFVAFGYISLGLVATIKTGDIMRQHKMGIPYHRIQKTFFIVGILLLGTSLLREAGEFSLMEKGMLVAHVAAATIWLIWQGMDTHRKLR